LLNPSIRANNRAISASFSALYRVDESKGGATLMLSHFRPTEATAFTLTESICCTCHVGGLSNYVDSGHQDLYFQHERPGRSKEANWLPSPFPVSFG
jgi:hypothetical protein